MFNRKSANAKVVLERQQQNGNDFISRRYPFASDRTEYARNLGYKGIARVLVQDGLVVSHCYQDWLMFCGALRGSSDRGGRHARAA